MGLWLAPARPHGPRARPLSCDPSILWLLFVACLSLCLSYPLCSPLSIVTSYHDCCMSVKTAHMAYSAQIQSGFSPASAQIQLGFETPQSKLKLAHNVGRDMPNPQSESFGDTPSRLTYIGQKRSRGSNLNSTLWLT